MNENDMFVFCFRTKMSDAYPYCAIPDLCFAVSLPHFKLEQLADVQSCIVSFDSGIWLTLVDQLNSCLMEWWKTQALFDTPVSASCCFTLHSVREHVLAVLCSIKSNFYLFKLGDRLGQWEFNWAKPVLLWLVKFGLNIMLERNSISRCICPRDLQGKQTCFVPCSEPYLAEVPISCLQC